MALLQLLLGKDLLVVGLAAGKQVVDDAREFVGGCRDRFCRAELGSHAAVVVAQIRLAAVERLGGQP